MGWYIKKSLVDSKTVRVIGTDGTVSKEELRKTWTDEGLRRWKDNAMHGQFLRDMSETADAEQTWSWHINLKVQTEALQHGNWLQGLIT